MPLHRTKFINTYLDIVSLDEAVAHIEKCIENRKISHVVTPNVDQIIKIEKDPYFREICDHAELLLADGHPLLWIAKWYHIPLKEKICGSDLVPLLCHIAAQKGYSVYFLGALPGVAAKAAEHLKEEYPDLKVAGVYSPPFGFEKDADETAKIDRMLLESHADMLFVGMGVPKQDRFIYENMHRYQIPVSFSIGATIDFLAGEQKRAPVWMRKVGMEWLYRLLKDPKRMFRRYIIDDMQIFSLAIKYRPRRVKEKNEV